MNDNDIIKAFDILDKFKFFGGQRAGRELWFGKPVDVQNKDIADFVRDVTFLKDFITQQKAENERLQAENKEQDQAIINALHRMGQIRTEAIKEFAERLKDAVDEPTEIAGEDIDFVIDTIDNLVKEMMEEHNAEEDSV